MTQRRLAALCSACALFLFQGCGKTRAGATSTPDAGPTIGRIVSFTPPPDLDPATLPLSRTDAGAVILSGTAQAQLVWNPPTPGPMTAAAQCSRWVMGCLSSERTLDDCARSVPTCKTDQPWNEPACCPASCFQRYVTARLGGAKDIDAFMAAYLSSSDPCIPGLKAQLGGQP